MGTLFTILKQRGLLWLAALVLVAFTSSIHAANKPALPLGLLEAERLAIEKDAGISGEQTNTNSTATNPELSVDVTDTPAAITPLSKDTATMVKIGVKQGFMVGQSPELAAQRWGAISAAEEQADADHMQALLQKLRQAWLDAYLYQQILDALEATQGRLPADAKHKSPQKQLTRQQQATEKKLTAARAQLAKLIGRSNAARPMPVTLPVWPAPPPLRIMQDQLASHPKLQSNTARIMADRAGLQQNKQSNKTAVNLGFNYGILREDNTGDTRPDMIGMELQLKLPNSTKPSSKTNREQLTQAMLEQQLNYRELSHQLRKKYGVWQELATENSIPAPFLADPHARSPADLTIYLESLSDQVALAKARVDLLYFEVG